MLDACWTLLQIDPTLDEDDIRRAYARRLKEFRPDQDPSGFQRLVAARDTALAWAERALPESTPSLEIDLLDGSASSNVAYDGSADLEDPLANSNGNRGAEYGDEAPIGLDAASSGWEINTQQQVFDQLHHLMQAERSRSVQDTLRVWQVETWTELFNLAAGFSLQGHQRLRDEIGRHLAGFLPAFVHHHGENMHEFVRGHGVSAVVWLIECECGFAEHINHLAALCGRDAAMTYLNWVAHAQLGQEIVTRQKAGRSAYLDPTNGLPAFPREDRPLALDSKDIETFYDKALSTGRWPLKIDWISPFFPSVRLARAGLPQAGFALAGVTAALGIGGLFSSDPSVLIAIALGLLLLLAARFALAFYMPRLTVFAALSRVMSADQRLLWQASARERALAVHKGQASGTIVVETLCLVLIIIPFLLYFWSYMSLGDDINRPIETVAADTVASALEGVADNDQIPTKALLDFVDLIRDARLRNDLPVRSSSSSPLVRDARDISWLLGLRARHDQILGKVWLNLTVGYLSYGVSAVEGRERRVKLHAIAKAYRTAAPAQRLWFENMFSSLRSQLEKHNAPAFAAGIWASIPAQSPAPDLIQNSKFQIQQLTTVLPNP